MEYQVIAKKTQKMTFLVQKSTDAIRGFETRLTQLEEDKAKMTIKCNMKLGELVGVACDNAFVIPGDVTHQGQWERLLLRTAEQLSDLSQQIAMSDTSARLVKQQLKLSMERAMRAALLKGSWSSALLELQAKLEQK